MEAGESKVTIATRVVALTAALLLGALLVWGIFRIVGEEHKQSCIAEAVARHPGGSGGNSLFSRGAPTGRGHALDKCTATAF